MSASSIDRCQNEMTVEEALAKADQFSERDKGVPSVSRTLAAEVRRLRHDIERAMANHSADLNPLPPSVGPKADKHDYVPGCQHAWPGPGPQPVRFMCRCGTKVYRSYEDYCDD